MSSNEHSRFAILNHLVSRSTARAAREFTPPTHAALDLLKIIDQRRAKGWAIEFLHEEPDSDDYLRLSKNASKSFARLRDLKFSNVDGVDYATLLVEYVDQNITAFPVVHTQTFKGREIVGEDQERGSAAAHVVVRLPRRGDFDDGRYRCVIEVVPTVSRSWLEHLLCRQLRRVTDSEVWTFPVTTAKRGRRSATRDYRYGVRLELHADVGRTIAKVGAGGAELIQMVFTKRQEEKGTAIPKVVDAQDFVADIRVTVGAKQGPADPLARLSWASAIRQKYEGLGFETRLSFRGPSGDVSGGEVHPAIAGATDLLMCSRQLVSYAKAPRLWVSAIDHDVELALMSLTAEDELWEHR